MYTLIDKNDKYIEMAEGENKMLVPSKAAIIVDDESTITTVKTIASRRTLASIDTSTPPTPPTPTFQGKWIATYSDSHTESAECDSTSAITQNEINKTNLVSLEISDCVTSIDTWTFRDCSSLTSVTIGNSVTSIAEGLFFGCIGLTSITIPDSVTTIDTGALRGCGFESITIPSGVTNIGWAALGYCDYLTSIIVEAITPPTLSSVAFEATPVSQIYVPSESVSAYQSAEGWSDYADRIRAIPTN